jgi:hypothetical protein
MKFSHDASFTRVLDVCVACSLSTMLRAVVLLSVLVCALADAPAPKRPEVTITPQQFCEG